MDDDFLAEHFLSVDQLDLPAEAFSGELIDPAHNHAQPAIPSTADINMEITLNATNEHVELTSKFFNNPLLSDIRLRVGPITYHAHKFILAKSSDVLATLLYSQHWTSTEAEVLLEEQDECQGDVFEK
jgi:hypothetical protein